MGLDSTLSDGCGEAHTVVHALRSSSSKTRYVRAHGNLNGNTWQAEIPAGEVRRK